MPVVYVKDPHQTSREKLDIPGDFKGETVRSLKTLIAGKIGLDQECFMLMYAGRVLKQGKALSEYNIIDGVTIFYIKKKKEERRVREIQAEALSKIKQMLQNPRVFAVLQRLVKNPSLIASMLKESSILNTPGVQMLIHNVDLREHATDPEALIKAFKNCPEVIVSVADILNLLGTAVEQVTKSTGYDHDLVEGELGVMFDRVADGADYFIVDRDQDNMDLANAQTQMFQYSQALQAHRARNNTTGNQTEPMETTTGATPQSPPPQQSLEPPQVTNISRQESTGSTGGGITPDMLADALSYVQPQQQQQQQQQQQPPQPQQQQQQESPPPRPLQFDPAGLQARIPMRIPQPPITASGPRIRARLPVGTCLSPLELMQALQSIGQTTRNARQQSSSQPTSEQPSSQPTDEQPSSLPSGGQLSSLPSGGQPSSLPSDEQPSSLPSGGQPSSLPSGIQQQSSSSSSQHSSKSQQRSRSSDRQRHKYRKQLEQLKGMGIGDEGAILHTLEATKGDINAALELLIGSGDIIVMK